MHVKKSCKKPKDLICSFPPYYAPIAGNSRNLCIRKEPNIYLRSKHQCNQVGKGMVFPQSSHYTSHRLNMDPLDRK